MNEIERERERKIARDRYLERYNDKWLLAFNFNE